MRRLCLSSRALRTLFPGGGNVRNTLHSYTDRPRPLSGTRPASGASSPNASFPLLPPRQQRCAQALAHQLVALIVQAVLEGHQTRL